MVRRMTNVLLHKAKVAKSDEFYTQFDDIERELQYYMEHFRGKTIYCNCDDARISNFYKYFYLNFKKLGLKRLIASCFRQQTNDLFNNEKCEKGFYTDYRGEDTPQCENIIPITYFNGDGDFRSSESIQLLQQSDIVVTNPPFSLFREFIAQVIRFKKDFLIIGNINAITYKEVFNLIQTNQIWLGVNMGRGISGFIVPNHYELYGTETKIDEVGNRIISPNNCLWLTNLKTPNRSSFIELKKTYKGNEISYPKYDNYDGININKTQDIPCDYNGAMGVPITFLHKYNPSQFEIIKFRKGIDEKDLSVNGKCPYFRILIRNKHPNTISMTAVV